jgi:hypothetical protein
VNKTTKKQKISAADLTGLAIARVIIHDIPQRSKTETTEPTLTDLECQLHQEAVTYILDRLKQALGSSRSYEIQFDPASASPVPGLVRSSTAETLTSDAFVAMSHQIARHLFANHTRATSPGLLAVMDCFIHGEQGLAVLKLARQEATQIELLQKDGKRVFDATVLHNLVLGEGTRFFKSALFQRIGEEDDDVIALACDEQIEEHSMAHFWRNFLGCKFVEQPSVMTERYFNVTMDYISQQVSDPVQKTAMYESVLSELNSNAKAFTPKTFIRDHVPAKHRKLYQEFLEQHSVTLNQFEKDTKNIKSKLDRRQYITEKGAVVTAPVDHPEIVSVTHDSIIVTDTLKKVDHK